MLKMKMLGNVGSDATIKEHNGKTVINFSIAHNEKWTDLKGVVHEKTQWVNCGIWRKEAGKLAEHIKAGTSVYVEGNPSVSCYKNRDGEHVADLSLNVSLFQFAGGSSEKLTDEQIIAKAKLIIAKSKPVQKAAAKPAETKTVKVETETGEVIEEDEMAFIEKALG